MLPSKACSDQSPLTLPGIGRNVIGKELNLISIWLNYRVMMNYQASSTTQTSRAAIGIHPVELNALLLLPLMLCFSIRISLALNEMSNIIWLWIYKIYDCPWRKLITQRTLWQMCTYLIAQSIKSTSLLSLNCMKQSGSKQTSLQFTQIGPF